MREHQRPIAEYAVAALISACLITISIVFRLSPVARVLPLLLLVGIIVTARLGGFGPSIVVTVVCVLAIDYFVVPPFQSFNIDSPADIFELVLICALGPLVGRQIGALRPVGAMSQLMSSVATERDFSRRLGLVGGNDQVRQLAQKIDLLLASVDDTLRAHRDFMAETSHDLRSPLLALQINLDLMEGEEDPAARQHCIDEARLQVDRMSRLVADVMVLMERETFLLSHQEPLNFTRIVRRAVTETRRYAGGDRVQLEAPGTLMVLGNELRLAQIVTNLLENALKHTPPEAMVTVALERVGDKAQLRVTDTGPGIAPEHMPRIFQRGYRVDPNNNSGHGLGLAIVERLTEAHGGEIRASSERGGGSSFTVTLPIWEAS